MSVEVTVNGLPLPHVVYHSPSGFEWGYGGSGPADLALSILAHYLGETVACRRYLWKGFMWTGEMAEPTALRLHQKFKWEVISRLPREGWTLRGEQVAEWLRSRGVTPPERAVVYEGRRAG